MSGSPYTAMKNAADRSKKASLSLSGSTPWQSGPTTTSRKSSKPGSRMPSASGICKQKVDIFLLAICEGKVFPRRAPPLHRNVGGRRPDCPRGSGQRTEKTECALPSAGLLLPGGDAVRQHRAVGFHPNSRHPVSERHPQPCFLRSGKLESIFTFFYPTRSFHR